MRSLAAVVLVSVGVSGCTETVDCKLIGAVKDADTDALKSMLHEQHAGAVSCEGVDVFTVAATSRNGYESAVHLIEAGVRPMRVDGAKTTALHEAAMWGDLRMVRLLVENGLDPSSKDGDLATPLDLANERRDRAGVEISGYLRGLRRQRDHSRNTRAGKDGTAQ